MDEVATSERHGFWNWTWSSKRTLVIAAVIATALVATRLLWDRFLDPFEDGYQNWWIASSFAQTGKYGDMYSGMTRGNWLPGYYAMAAPLVIAFGGHIMALLKAVNVLFSLGTAAIVYMLARPRSREVAVLAAVLFALNPADLVISSYATPDALSLYVTFAGVLLVERRLLGARQSLAFASVFFLFASALRYETWGFLAVYLLWTWRSKKLTTRQLTLLAAPALVFIGAWWAWTSQYGFLPSIIVNQTSADVRYKASIGLLPSAWDRVASFLAWYVMWTPFAVLAIIWALKAERRTAFTGILLMFYLAVVAYTSLGFGNPSARYIHLTVPIVCIYSASALVALKGWLARRFEHAPRFSLHAPVAAALGLSLLLVVVVENPTPTPGTMLQGMQRAGEYLNGLSLPEGKLLLSESPIAAYYSGFPASRIIGSTFLPADPGSAVSYLVDNVAYVVMVTVPYYQLRTLFPDQANGVNGNHLQLLYDATGVEFNLGAPRVLVFRVVP